MEGLVEEYKKILSSDEPASTKFWELEKRLKNDKTLMQALSFTDSCEAWRSLA